MINIREIAEAVESDETVTVNFFSSDGYFQGTVDRVNTSRTPLTVTVEFESGEERVYYVRADDVVEVES